VSTANKRASAEPCLDRYGAEQARCPLGKPPSNRP
jgi:hypothetical protein